MPPPPTRLDPEGYYDRLGLDPAATPAEIVAAFRGKARLLHPDVPDTGNAAAFVAVKQAYDVLSNQQRRSAYDHGARAAALDAAEPEANATARPVYPAPVYPAPIYPEPGYPVPLYPASAGPSRAPRFSDLPLLLWVGAAAFLCLCVYQATVHLLAPSPAARAEIPANAATVAPLSPSAHRAVLYGPAPVRLAGTPNFYVVPAADPAVLWRLDQTRGILVAIGQLPPFSAVQAVRLVRENAMLEVLLNDHGSGFISADHLTPGSAAAAHRAYCGYNAGEGPYDGEPLRRRGHGGGKLEVENRAPQPAVVKLRDRTGAVVLSVFLEPGGHAAFDGLPDGVYHADFAIGELWSRACNGFAAGMRARRMRAALTLPGDQHLVVAPDLGQREAVDIPDRVFERD